MGYLIITIKEQTILPSYYFFIRTSQIVIHSALRRGTVSMSICSKDLIAKMNP